MNDKNEPQQTVLFEWKDDMHDGFSSQDVGIVTLTGSDYGAAQPVYTIDSSMSGTIDLSGITIGASGPSVSSWSMPNMASSNSIDGVEEINTATGKKIDLDELADVVETIKKRLLIITPNFELHEKYPMLKELYDEYKAMERLLGGPDRSGLDDEL